MKKQRKHYTPEEKVAILRRHLLEQVPISELCDKNGLQPTVFYRWQKELFENGHHQDRGGVGFGGRLHDAALPAVSGTPASGRSTMAVVPSPGRLSISMMPPCSITTLRAMARPSPVPLPGSLVVKKGSKTCSRCAGLMPHPLSPTVKLTVPGERRRQLSRISPPSGTASSALLKRVSSRVSSRFRSAKTSWPRPSEVSTIRLARRERIAGWQKPAIESVTVA